MIKNCPITEVSNQVEPRCFMMHDTQDLKMRHLLYSTIKCIINMKKIQGLHYGDQNGKFTSKFHPCITTWLDINFINIKKEAILRFELTLNSPLIYSNNGVHQKCLFWRLFTGEMSPYQSYELLFHFKSTRTGKNQYNLFRNC